MTFDEFVKRIDAFVTEKNPAFKYTYQSAIPTAKAHSDSRSATWTQPGGIVNLFELENRVRVQGLSIITQGIPARSAAEQRLFETQRAHRFEYWVDKTDENARRVATDVARHLEGPTTKA